MFEDKTLVCKDCGKEFVWTAGEQEFYASQMCIRDRLMSAALELLAAILVLVGSAQNGNDLTIGGQGDGAGHAGTSVLCGLHDLSLIHIYQ